MLAARGSRGPDSALTSEVAARVVAEFADGATIASAAGAVGISPRTLQRWLERGRRASGSAPGQRAYVAFALAAAEARSRYLDRRRRILWPIDENGDPAAAVVGLLALAEDDDDPDWWDRVAAIAPSLPSQEENDRYLAELPERDAEMLGELASFDVVELLAGLVDR